MPCVGKFPTQTNEYRLPIADASAHGKFSHPRLRGPGRASTLATVSEDELGDALIRAAVEALRPIARRLIAGAVPFGKLEAKLRELFVEVAEREFVLADRPQTDSRVALLTGINRKEVRRLRSTDDSLPAPSTFGRNRAASLVSRWTADPRASDRSGNPKPIPYRASRGPSFVALAREIAGDLPPRAILDEMIRSGAVRLEPGGLVSLQARSYVPVSGLPEKLEMLGQDPPELIETMLRNVLAEAGSPLLQRRVFYDNVGSDGLAQLEAAVRKEGERFLREIDGLLSSYDRDRSEGAPGGERRTAGVGIYFFESPFQGGELRSSSGRRKRTPSRGGKGRRK